MNNFFKNLCQFSGKVVEGVALSVTAFVALVLTPVIIIGCLISPAIFKYCCVDRHNKYLEILLNNLITDSIMMTLLERGLLSAKSIAFFAEDNPRCLSAKAVKKSIKIISYEAIIRMASKEEYFKIDAFAEEILIRGINIELTPKILQQLINVAKNRKLYENLERLLEAQDYQSIIEKISKGDKKILLYMIKSKKMALAIVKTIPQKEIPSLLDGAKDDILDELLTSSTPSDELVLGLLTEFSRYKRNPARIQRLIRQHGVKPAILDKIYFLEDQLQEISLYLKEREDRLSIQRGPESLRGLLEKRDLTDYGRGLLTEMANLSVYQEYLISLSKCLNKNDLAELLINGDDDVIKFLEQKYKIVISSTPKLTALLIARKCM